MPAKLIRHLKSARLVVRNNYSSCVRAKLDENRPKYNEAVKSLAAFAQNEHKFNVLVAHLDAAVKEALGVGGARYVKVPPGRYRRVDDDVLS